MKQLRLTEVERELIEAGRNYKRSYPNGAAEYPPKKKIYLLKYILLWQ